MREKETSARIFVSCVALVMVPLTARPGRPESGSAGRVSDAAAGASVAAVVEPVSAAIRDRFHLSDFYRKQLTVKGFPILSSEKVSDFALLEAQFIISRMLAGRDDVVEGLIARNFRCAVMAATEFTTDVPEHSDLRPATYWNRRARGLGPTTARPCVSCGEENLLQYAGDPYSTENILIHEFAHAIHEGLKKVDPKFDPRLRSIYEKAVEQGLWKGKYAGRNREEYWAEGVQSYFGSNRENDHDHNHVDTRKELKEYDPRLADLLDEVFRGNPWQYVPPRDREKKAHLTGFDAAKAPSFAWPKSLERVEIRKGAAPASKRRPWSFQPSRATCQSC